ncbi:MAG: signal peptidase II [Actinobacteria bacterium]|nr:signal peptidase II [Actinomycetota bacterium]
MMLGASAKSHARSLRVGLALIGVAGAALAIDASTKSAAGASLDPGERSQILPGLAMVHAENSGAAFGLLAGGGTWLLPAISALAIVAGIVILSRRRLLVSIPGALAMGGAVGNLVDRFGDSRVTDWLELPNWPPFNLADVSIVVGIALVAMQLLGRTGTRETQFD